MTIYAPKEPLFYVEWPLSKSFLLNLSSIRIWSRNILDDGYTITHAKQNIIILLDFDPFLMKNVILSPQSIVSLNFLLKL
jgi:hypothetical protein